MSKKLIFNGRELSDTTGRALRALHAFKGSHGWCVRNAGATEKALGMLEKLGLAVKIEGKLVVSEAGLEVLKDEIKEQAERDERAREASAAREAKHRANMDALARVGRLAEVAPVVIEALERLRKHCATMHVDPETPQGGIHAAMMAEVDLVLVGAKAHVDGRGDSGVRLGENGTFVVAEKTEMA